MIDPKKQQEMEQAAAGMREGLPATWWAHYQGCLDKGFDRSQSMLLTQILVLAMLGKGTFLPGQEGPHSDKDE